LRIVPARADANDRRADARQGSCGSAGLASRSFHLGAPCRGFSSARRTPRRARA
jgi:hypothetical protein